jgi:hypothetical protein
MQIVPSVTRVIRVAMPARSVIDSRRGLASRLSSTPHGSEDAACLGAFGQAHSLVRRGDAEEHAAVGKAQSEVDPDHRRL